MTRILLLSPYEPPADGIAQHSKNLVGAWDSAGHTTLVMAPSGRGQRRDSHEGNGATISHQVHVLPRRRTWNEARDFAPDIVVVQFALAALSMNIWSMRSLSRRFKARGVPIVVLFHEPAREYELLGSLTRALYRSWSHVTSVPLALSATGRLALESVGLFPRVSQIPHGTNSPLGADLADVERVRAAYGIVRPLVLTLGFVTPDKGTDILLDAAPQISRISDDRVQILIAGAPRPRRGLFRFMGRRDAKFQKLLEARARSHHDVAISFCGYIPDEDLTPLLYLADVVALPYRAITQSGIAAQALASRAVIVASDLSGLRDSLGPAAIYVPSGDPVALAEAIGGLLGEAGSSLRSQLRELAGHRATENTFDQVASEIITAGVPS